MKVFKAVISAVLLAVALSSVAWAHSYVRVLRL